mgnify:CR=1 FL=1
MSNELIEVLIMAAVAGLVLARLYAVLGRRTEGDRPREPKPQPVGLGPASAAGPLLSPSASQESPEPSLAAMLAADPHFDGEHFLRGAKSAYALIVKAFSDQDAKVLQPLLTAPVFEAYAQAMAARAEGQPGPELVRLKASEIIDSDVENTMAQISVRFEAELADGAIGVRDTKEIWTFERDLRDRDPTWRLAGVAQA